MKKIILLLAMLATPFHASADEFTPPPEITHDEALLADIDREMKIANIHAQWNPLLTGAYVAQWNYMMGPNYGGNCCEITGLRR